MRVWVVSNAPELSIAVGSVHDTVVPVLKNDTNSVMSLGQEVTTGGVVSPEQEKKKVGQFIHRLF